MVRPYDRPYIPSKWIGWYEKQQQQLRLKSMALNLTFPSFLLCFSAPSFNTHHHGFLIEHSKEYYYRPRVIAIYANIVALTRC